MMKTLESFEEFEHFLQSEKVTVFIFTAKTCPDCWFIQPFMPMLMEKYHPFEFVSVDRDKFIGLCEDYDILGVPSFLVYQQGKEIGRFIGKQRKTKQEIDNFFGECRNETSKIIY